MLTLRDKLIVGIATLFGVGYLPLFPGTAACVVAVAVIVLVKDTAVFFLITAAVLILSFAVSGRAEEVFKEKDCKKIVIDDFAGMLISFLFVPHRLEWILIGFFLFRFLDILKIPPADRIERLPGAGGIVGDDVVAGIYTNLLLQLFKLLP